MHAEPQAHDFELEALEDRVLPAATPLGISTVIDTLGTQLRITGTSGNDTINVSKRGPSLMITTSGGFSRQYNGTPFSIRIDGLEGNDQITISSDIHTPVILFGSAGNDSLNGGSGNDRLYGGEGTDVTNGNAGNDVIVTVGGGAFDRSTHGTGRDSFWMDSSTTEIVTDAAASETSVGAVHRIGKFSGGVVSPSNTPNAAPASSTVSLSDPTLTTGASAYKNFGSSPLFSTAGPSPDDIMQGQLGDCYLLASLGSIAKTDPGAIRESIADLGDGTYAVQFTRGAVKSHVRVDADLPVNSAGNLAYAQAGAQKSIWAAIIEKAYAFFRKALASYASLQGGFMGEVYSDLGMKTGSIFSAATSDNLLTQLQNDVGSGKAVTFATKNNVVGAPVIGGHAYMVDQVVKDQTGKVSHLRLRNPWGTDGAGNDGKNDGYVTLSAAQAIKAFWFACTAKS